MTSKEYLRSIRNCQEEIQLLQKEAQYWKDLAQSISKNTLEPHYNPNKRTEASYAACLEKYDEITREISDKIRQLSELRNDINAQIEKIDRQEEKSLLRYRYFNRCSWDSICSAMGISRRTAFRIHRRALDKIISKK